MAGLSILGWSIGAASMQRVKTPFGNRTDTLLGGKRDRLIAPRTAIDVITAPMSGEDMEALVGLLAGENHVFPFNADVWSVRGLPPVTGWTATISATQSKYGGFSSYVTSISWPAEWIETPNVYAVMLWRYNGATWDHYIVRSDGAKWLNGTRNDATATAWLTFNTTVGTGAIALTGSPSYFDDLVFFSFMPSTALATALYSHCSSLAMTKLPTVYVSSDGLAASGNYRAFDVTATNRPFWDSGVWDPTGATVRFKLMEAES